MRTLKYAIIAGSAFALSASLTPAFAQIVLADFEPGSGYTAATNLPGQDNWTGAQDDRAKVTPDPGVFDPNTNQHISGSGYTFVINGSQSAYITGVDTNNAIKTFASEGVTAADFYELSWLQAHPDAVGSGSGGGLYLINAGGSTPVGMFARNTVDGPRIFLSGTSELNTGVPYQFGGGGAPTLNDVYRFTLQFDFANSQVTGFSENISEAGSPINVGTVAINPALTATEIATNYGVFPFAQGGTLAIDDITVNPVPEPTSLALLGGAFGLLLARSRRSRARQA